MNDGDKMGIGEYGREGSDLPTGLGMAVFRDAMVLLLILWAVGMIALVTITVVREIS